jgi:hypothetical protein
MLLPSCCHAATAQHCRRRCRCCAASMLPRCRCHAATTAMLPPLPRCHLSCRVVVKLLPPPLPPHCHHHRRHHCCQAAAAAAKLPLPLLSTLCDRFDNEKELYKMTNDDFFCLSQIFQLGVEILHGEMLSIFDALVHLSLNCICLQLLQ